METTFYKIFLSLCEERGKKPQQVAKEAGIASGTVSGWKNDGNVPNTATLNKLAFYFNVTVSYLLGENSQPVEISTTSPDIQRLVKYFSECDGDGQWRIIQCALNEYDRTTAERKKTASRAVAELKNG